MSARQIDRICRRCNRHTLHEKRIFGFGWGFLLTLLTAGLFLPFWLLIFACDCFRAYRCNSCGNSVRL